MDPIVATNLALMQIATASVQTEMSGLALSAMGSGSNPPDSMSPPPPPSPPSAPPGGRSSSAPTKMDRLMARFARQAETTLSPTFAEALKALVATRISLNERASQSVVSPLLATATTSLLATVDSDMGLIPPADWTDIASAVHVGGLLVMRHGRDDYRVLDLFQASARLLSYVAKRDESLSKQDLFLEDRLIADTQMSLRGWLRSEYLRPKERETLAENLVRVGVASGSVRWRGLNALLPNLMGATLTFFDGANPRIFEEASLLPPYSYFESAAAWRPRPVGDLEGALAVFLDSSNTAGALQLLTTALSAGLPQTQDGKSLLSFLELAVGPRATAVRKFPS